MQVAIQLHELLRRKQRHAARLVHAFESNQVALASSDEISDEMDINMSNLPHFLCIGAQKAGTSWLYKQLKQHPEIWMPPVKELHYFDHLFCKGNRSWTTGHIRRAVFGSLKWHVNHGIEPDFDYIRYLSGLASGEMFTEQWYRTAFDRPGAKGKVIGDITPEYCTLPLDGVHYVKQLLGDNVRIIYIIRDPYERALSQLRMNVERRGIGESSSIDEWLAAADFDAIENRGNYAEYIPRWKSVFASGQVKIMPFDLIKADPCHFLRELERFLELEISHEYDSAKEPVHQTKKYKIPSVISEKIRELASSQEKFYSDLQC
ncbi:sulfotransferase domain-containing protein [Thiorhodovibrio frisius]|nr:sulfotransferase domain-containing protein [Thiorhodovibrio frisius]